MIDRLKQLAIRELRYWMVGWLIASMICVVVRPFETDQLSLLIATCYWFGINGIAIIIMYGILRIFNGQNFAIAALLGSITFSLIFTPILILINDAIFSTGIHIQFFITNALIALLIFAVVWAALTWRGQPEITATPKFENRLSKFQTAKLWAISAQDHYLSVQTSEGAEMILMRMGDALTELAGRDGVQIHRSHWVARAGIAKSTTTTITLQNGETLPISRGNSASVKAFLAQNGATG